MSKKVILFQGDSITDSGRDKNNQNDLGSGYAMMVAKWFEENQSEQAVEFINKGISGNRVVDLQARWDEECIQIQPDILSILIGINDVWRRYDSDDPTSVEAYEKGFRDLLEQVKNKTKAKLVILEPFLLDYPEDRIAWREDLDPKRAVAKKLAKEFDAEYIQLDDVFKKALALNPPEYWAGDGVHPSEAGHELIMKEWIGHVNI